MTESKRVETQLGTPAVPDGPTYPFPGREPPLNSTPRQFALWFVARCVWSKFEQTKEFAEVAQKDYPTLLSELEAIQTDHPAAKKILGMIRG